MKFFTPTLLIFSSFSLSFQFEPRLDDFSFSLGRSPRIINGLKANENEFPFAVSLRITFQGKGYSCGASLISNTWVLTAAHCMYPVDTAISISDLKVGYGSSSREKQTFVQVKRIINGPRYNKKDATPKDDISLVELSEPINIDNVKTALIKFTADPLSPNQQTTAIGWGASTPDPSSSAVIDLQKVNLLVGTESFCKSIAPTYFSNGPLVCTSTDPGGFDTCYGDSGGPLLKKENNGQYSLSGVLSFGDNPKKLDRPVCGDPTGASFFTRPVSYLDFITSNTGLSREGLLYSPISPGKQPLSSNISAPGDSSSNSVSVSTPPNSQNTSGGSNSAPTSSNSGLNVSSAPVIPSSTTNAIASNNPSNSASSNVAPISATASVASGANNSANAPNSASGTMPSTGAAVSSGLGPSVSANTALTSNSNGAYSTSMGITSLTIGNNIYVIKSNVEYFNKCNASQSSTSPGPAPVIIINNYQAVVPAVPATVKYNQVNYNTNVGGYSQSIPPSQLQPPTVISLPINEPIITPSTTQQQIQPQPVPQTQQQAQAIPTISQENTISSNNIPAATASPSSPIVQIPSNPVSQESQPGATAVSNSGNSMASSASANSGITQSQAPLALSSTPSDSNAGAPSAAAPPGQPQNSGAQQPSPNTALPSPGVNSTPSDSNAGAPPVATPPGQPQNDGAQQPAPNTALPSPGVNSTPSDSNAGAPPVATPPGQPQNSGAQQPNPNPALPSPGVNSAPADSNPGAPPAIPASPENSAAPSPTLPQPGVEPNPAQAEPSAQTSPSPIAAGNQNPAQPGQGAQSAPSNNMRKAAELPIRGGLGILNSPSRSEPGIRVIETRINIPVSFKLY
ncbi:Chymotrypsin-like elastase family member 2A [Smittium culicis]|uniref:Chymotrypsin-like elastase family member 2A n=1 Tax=Smittium culicis TaxID=133412 RepID=A0A1R1YFT2_9FUNG|nr:Chymotrypsin-like elastase family member 2A [Smittium culicis]